MSDNQKWEIIQGDALKVLSGFAPGTFDAVMKRAEQVYRGAPAQREFTLLGDLIRVSYCRTTGLLPCPGCREDGKMAEGWFLRGTEPRTVCDCHGRKVGDPEPPDEIK